MQTVNSKLYKNCVPLRELTRGSPVLMCHFILIYDYSLGLFQFLHLLKTTDLYTHTNNGLIKAKHNL